MFFNFAFPHLFFLVSPSIISNLTQLDYSILEWRLVGKFVMVIFWQVFAWRLVIKLLNANSKSKVEAIS